MLVYQGMYSRLDQNTWFSTTVTNGRPLNFCSQLVLDSFRFTSGSGCKAMSGHEPLCMSNFLFAHLVNPHDVYSANALLLLESWHDPKDFRTTSNLFR